MLKKSAIKKILTSTLALLIMLLFCAFPSKNNENDNVQITYVAPLTIPIYAIDYNNYVARTFVAKNDEDLIPYIIDVLTKGSMNANILNTGFTAIIPANTKLLDYTLEDNILILNFSKEFLNIEEDKEDKLIEAIIYSLCEDSNIKKLQIKIEGEILSKMPSGKNMPLYLDKTYGINKKYNLNSIKGSVKTTTYYISKYNDNIYYIPITKISNDTSEPVEIIVKELKSTPIYETNFISYLNASYELKDYQILENSISLSFNNKLLAGLTDNEIIENVKYTLALSIRDTYDITDIVINID